MTLSRPTASSIRNLRWAACIGLGLLGLSAAPALANASEPPAIVNEAPATLSAALAVCPGQTFGQPFTGLGDFNYYTLVPGSEFRGPSEGWELTGGAKIVNASHPDGSAGSALDLPGGSAAVSPPVCVTLRYPTARIWTQAPEGSGDVVVSVAYTNTKTASKPKAVGSIEPSKAAQETGHAAGWTLSEPFNVQPELGGTLEATREVRFIFTSGSGGGDTQLYGLFVDPRMR